MSAIPRSGSTRYQIGAAIYKNGPMSIDEVMPYLHANINRRSAFVSAMRDMNYEGQLEKIGTTFHLSSAFRAYFDNVSEIITQEIGSMPEPITREFKPLNPKYFIGQFMPRPECELREVHFKALVSNVPYVHKED